MVYSVGCSAFLIDSKTFVCSVNITAGSPTRGTPQGGVLSPQAWNFNFEGFLKLFGGKSRVKVVGYADDAALIIKGNDPKSMARIMQNAVNKAVKWGKDNSLKFAPNKTEAVLFTHKKVHWHRVPEIVMGGTKIPYQTEVTYLGVTLDHKLTWKAHVDKKFDKAKKLLHKVRTAAGSLWGLSPKMALWFYTAIVRPMVTYGSIVWVKATDSVGVRGKLEKIQRLALTSMGCFRQSTPTAGLEVITHTTPLWLHVRQEAAMAYLRTAQCVQLDRKNLNVHNRPMALGHRQFIKEFLDEIYFQTDDTDRIDEQKVWHKPFVLDKDSFATGEPKWDADVNIYTDGSKDEIGHSGAGVVAYNKGKNKISYAKFHLGLQATVFQCETYAIKEAATMLRDLNIKNKKIVIYSDSRAALLALDSNTLTSRLVRDTLENFKSSGITTNSIILRWVKGHADHLGNEAADALAKEGALNEQLLADDLPQVSTKILRGRLRDCIVNRWQYDWSYCQPCEPTKLFFPLINKQQSLLATCGNRKHFSAYVQIVTDHNHLKGHDTLVEHGFHDTYMQRCNGCWQAPETAHHIIAECPKYNKARREAFYELDVLPTPFQITPHLLILQILQNGLLTRRY